MLNNLYILITDLRIWLINKNQVKIIYVFELKIIRTKLDCEEGIYKGHVSLPPLS